MENVFHGKKSFPPCNFVLLVKINKFDSYRWFLKSTMRPIGHFDSSSLQHNDGVLVFGVSRSKLAVLFFTVMLVSLFLTFHVLYDSAVYNIQVNICLFI